MFYTLKRGHYLLVFSVLLLPVLHAQNGLHRSAARLMGPVFIHRVDSLNQSAWVPGWFPMLMDQSQLQGGVLNRYGLKALTELYVRFHRPLASGMIQGNMTSSGDATFRVSSFQIGLTKRLLEDWCVGVDIGGTQVHVSGYGNRWTPQTLISLSGRFDAKTQMGIQWENPQTWMGNKFLSSYASPRIRAGLIRAISERLDLAGWMDWERASQPGIFLQCLYRPEARWSVDLGWGRSPDQISLGLQRELSKVIVRTAFSQDALLGTSFLFSCRFIGSGKKSIR